MNHPVVLFIAKVREYSSLKREWHHRTKYRNYGKAETFIRKLAAEFGCKKLQNYEVVCLKTAPQMFSAFGRNSSCCG